MKLTLKQTLLRKRTILHLLDVIQNAILDTKAADVDAVLTTSTPEGTIADLITNATATIGEKITFRRVSVVEKQMMNSSEAICTWVEKFLHLLY